MNVLDLLFLKNPLRLWVLAVSVTLLAFVILAFAKKFGGPKAVARAQKSAAEWDDFAATLIERTRYFFLLMAAILLGSSFLTMPDSSRLLLRRLGVLALLIQIAVWANGLYDCWRARIQRQRKQDGAAGLTTYAAFGFLVRLAVWTIVALLALDNFGIHITALVAGLGVGGIAVALAVQNILGDLFASMSIVLDKPFVVGDFIVVDDLQGTIEHIGLKTTRIRSLGGEELVFANSDLLKSRIRNYQRMEERRAVFALRVSPQTPLDKLAAIPGMIQEIIEAQELARFERSRFKAIGDFSLNFENSYYIKSPDYGTYLEVQQAINLAVLRRFQEEGIEFAYPAQRVFISGGPSAPEAKG
jgi:small-conductance mechanosensitive channel